VAEAAYARVPSIGTPGPRARLAGRRGAVAGNFPGELFVNMDTDTGYSESPGERAVIEL